MSSKIYKFLCISTVLGLISCQNETEKTHITQEEAVAISTQDTLSEEDVLKMMNASDVPVLSYSGAITNSSVKEYFYESDSNQNTYFILKTEHPDVAIFLYKEAFKMVLVDSVKKVKVKDYIFIKDSTECNVYNKKPTKYKAVVKFTNNQESNDSTAVFSIDVLKK